MSHLGKIFKLLEERTAIYNTNTTDILKLAEDRLTPAFQKLFNAPNRRIVWHSIESIDGTDKAVLVSGNMALEIGETVIINDVSTVVDESNVNQYNKFVKFAFPIIMLEMATVDELIDHVERISKIGSALSMTPENLSKVLDKAAEQYEELLLNDPSKVVITDSVTKPVEVLGFPAESLTDAQIQKLMMYEKADLGKVH
ncbi:hypothetical protein Xoosp13_237 [Xanthomonas phage Xoo-sp13]|nr:hypothetical protein Xoosp13_237 [Xanthomonas phage Xoo-sp13]